jgi:hypothetical protein
VHVRRPDRERERRHRDCGRQGEAEPGCEPAERAGVPGADRDSELTGGRSRQEAGDRDELRERLLVEPASPLDVLRAEVPDVRNGPAERRQAEAKRGADDLSGP